MGQRRRRPDSTCSSRTCRSASPKSTTSRTAISRTACRTRCSRRTTASRSTGAHHGADFGDCLGRRFRPLLLLRRGRTVHRGLLHRRPARDHVSRAEQGRAHRPRSARHLEHASRSCARRAAGRCSEVRPCIHEALHARGRRVYGGEMSGTTTSATSRTATAA